MKCKHSGTIVTTPRLGFELERFNGLSDSERSLAPQKSLEMLPPVYGESKPFEREALSEEDEHLTLDLRLRVEDGIIADVRARKVVKLVAVAAATSIFSPFVAERERERESRRRHLNDNERSLSNWATCGL